MHLGKALNFHSCSQDETSFQDHIRKLDFELKSWVPPALEISHSSILNTKISDRFLVNWYIDRMLEKYFKIKSASKNAVNDFTTSAHPRLSSVLVLSAITGEQREWKSTYAIFLWMHRCFNRRAEEVQTLGPLSVFYQVGCSSCKDINSPELFYMHVITVLLIENIKRYLK